MNMLLTIFAFIFFGALLLYTRNIGVDHATISSQNEVAVAAFASAQSIIEEAKLKAFDESTVGGIEVADSTSFTDSLLLGEEPGELAASTPSTPDVLTPSGYKSSTNFDDVDDYQGYCRLINGFLGRNDQLIDSVTVRYAKFSDPNSVSVDRSYCKRMTVYVRVPASGQSFSFTYLFTY